MCSPSRTLLKGSPRESTRASARRTVERVGRVPPRGILILFVFALAFCLVLFPGQSPGETLEPTPSTSERVLRIAADPNNLPFSNDQFEGFENKIAALVGRELNAQVQYIWRAQR